MRVNFPQGYPAATEGARGMGTVEQLMGAESTRHFQECIYSFVFH
jgi:hypothetical protein